ncbi:MAG: T9SS type A sorting domain-containing protein [Ignavibacteria bacterium]|nr:T9SS type A sorting domain-containing protein [Ignavibacteria bacterium]
MTGEDLGTNDVDNGVNDLLSKAYDVTTYTDPVIRYYRWYSNDAGANPGIGIWAVRISSDGGATWKDIEQTHEANASWKPMVFRIKDYVELSDKFKIKFSASDSVVDKQSLVEAAVDDFEILEIDKSLVGVEHAEALPARLDLEQNYPNPFNPSTTIAFSLPEAAAARISIYSPLGMLVSVPVNGMVPAGRHSLRFDARGLPSGVYTCELLSGGRRLTRAMVVMK